MAAVRSARDLIQVFFRKFVLFCLMFASFFCHCVFSFSDFLISELPPFERYFVLLERRTASEAVRTPVNVN
jgi:hypothetical protein